MLDGKKVKDDSFRRMKGSEVCLEWVESDARAMQEPFVVENPDGLGMKMPDTDFSVDDVVEAVGEDTLVEVIGIYILPFNTSLTDVFCRRCISVQFSGVDAGKMG